MSGTARELGSFDIIIAAGDAGANTFEQPLTLTVKKLAITKRLLPDAFVGERYTATLKAVGGQPPYRWTPLALGAGWILDPNTGELSGTPTRQDAGGLAVMVADSGGNTKTQLVDFQVRGLTILNSHFLPEATVGVPYRMRFQTKGSSSPLGWRIAQGDIGSIGLQLDPRTGEMSGTPAKPGNFLVTVSAEEQFGSHSRDFTLTVNQPGTVGRSRRRP